MGWKKIQVIIFVLVVIVSWNLTGCGRNKMSSENMQKSEALIPNNAETTHATETAGQTEETVTPTEERIVNVSTEEQEITLKNTDFHPAKAFGSNGEYIFLTQWKDEERKAAFYEMKIGSELLQETGVEIPTDMNVYGITTDQKEHHYVLMRSSYEEGGRRSCIREYEGDNLLGEIDISQVMENMAGVNGNFLVDETGNFYIRGLGGSMYLSEKGEFLWESKNDLQEIKDSYAITLGKDGNIYITYIRDDTTYLGQVNKKDGTIEKEYILDGISSDDRILAVGQGTDSDFLLYGTASGIWAFDCESTHLEKRRDMTEGNLPLDEYIIIRAFLPDGRLLIVKNVSENGEIVEQTLQYIPAGK